MNLTRAANLTKTVLILFIAFVFTSIATLTLYNIWRSINPPKLTPDLKPNTSFGKLPYPKLPSSRVPSNEFTYSVDTVDGNLPVLDKVLRVFYIPKTYATLLSGEKSKELAQKFNLPTNQEALSNTSYRFRRDAFVLTVDLDTGNFIYRNEQPQRPDAKLEFNGQLIQDFLATLKRLEITKEDLKPEQGKIEYLRLQDNSFVPTTNPNEADAAHISIWQQNIEENTPIVTQDPTKALVNAFVVKNARDINNYISLEFIHWPVERDNFATYPAKPIREAFEQLQQGKGIVVVQPTNQRVSIVTISVAYYLSDSYVPFMQPIYVFEGPNFRAYVPAISEQYLEQTQ